MPSVSYNCSVSSSAWTPEPWVQALMKTAHLDPSTQRLSRSAQGPLVGLSISSQLLSEEYAM